MGNSYVNHMFTIKIFDICDLQLYEIICSSLNVNSKMKKDKMKDPFLFDF